VATRRVKVGEAYIEVEIDVDGSQLNKHQAATDKWLVGLQRRWEKAYIEPQRKIAAEQEKYAARQAQLRQRADAAEARAAAQRQASVQREMAAFARAHDAKRRLEEKDRAEGERHANAWLRQQQRAYDASHGAYSRMLTKIENDQVASNLRATNKIKQDTDRLGQQSQRTFVRNLSEGFGALISMLPARLERLFTSSGPVGLAIGVALVASFAHAFVVAAGIFSSVMIAAIGAGGIATAIALVAGDARVDKAFSSLSSHVGTQLRGAATSFIPPLVQAAPLLKQSFDRIMPNIKGSFLELSAVIVPLAKGFGTFMEKVAPAIERAARAAQPLLNMFATYGLPMLGDKIAAMFDKISEKAPELNAAFRFFLNMLGAAIDLAGTLMSTGLDMFRDISYGIMAASFALGVFLKGLSLIPGMSAVIGPAATKAMATFGDKLLDVSRNIKGAFTDTQRLKPGIQGLIDGFKEQGKAAESAATAIDAVRNAWKQGIQPAADLDGIIEQQAAAMFRLRDSVKEHGAALGTNSEAGIANSKVMRELVTGLTDQSFAELKAGKSVQEVTKNHEKRKDALREELLAMGFNRQEVDKLIGKYGELPKDIVTKLALEGHPQVKAELEKVAGGAKNAAEKAELLRQKLLGGGSGRAGGGGSFGPRGAGGLSAEAKAEMDRTVANVGTGATGVTGKIAGMKASVLAAASAAFSGIPTSANTNLTSTNAIIGAKVAQAAGRVASGAGQIKTNWQGGWAGVVGSTSSSLTGANAIIGAKVAQAAGRVASGAGQIRSHWQGGWSAVVGSTGTATASTVGIIGARIAQAAARVGAGAGQIRTGWQGGWSAVVGSTNTATQSTVGIIGQRIGQAAGRVAAGAGQIKTNWQGNWSAVVGTTGTATNTTVGIIGQRVAQAAARVAAGASQIKTNWSSGVNAVAQATRIQMAITSTLLTVQLISMEMKMKSSLARLQNAWNSVFSALPRLLQMSMLRSLGAAAAGMKGILNVLNKGIGNVNTALNKIGATSRIPAISTNFATGGYVRGPGTGTSDSINARLSHGEFVVNAKSTRKHAAIVQAINDDKLEQTLPGFARGGFTYPAIIALAKKSGIPNHPGSTYRPGDRVASGGLSYHASGQAVDFMGYSQDALSAFFRKISTREVIHQSQRTGRDWSAYGNVPGRAVPGHFNHLHIAMSPADIGRSGSAIGNIGYLMKSWGEVYNELFKKPIDGLGSGAGMPKNGIGYLGQGMGKQIGKHAAVFAKKQFDKLKKEFEALLAINASGNPDAAGAQQWAGVASQALKMLKLPQSWLKPLLTLIQRESGGNPRAVNRTDSNAARGTPSMGLMQTIGPTFNAYKYPGHSNILAPLDNILAGLRYIKARYGSIFKVQQAVGSSPRGYKNGGWAQPGWNFMHEPELALNSAQGKALEKRIEGGGSGGSPLIGELHIHAAPGMTQAEAKKIADTVIAEINKKAKRNGGSAGLRHTG
jgi:hypothetical protein